MVNDERLMPSALFGMMHELIKERLGEDWATGSPSVDEFMATLAINAQSLDGVHLVGEPELFQGEVRLTLWIDFPVIDLGDVDEVAFELFGRVAPEMLLSTRTVGERTMEYRFLAGSLESGHVGELELIGPYVAEFARLHGLRRADHHRFHA